MQGKQPRHDFNKRYLEIGWDRRIKFLPNDRETYVDIASLSDDTQIFIDDRFSYFGDTLHVSIKSTAARRVVFENVKKLDGFYVSGSYFVDLIFDGESFVPAIQLGNNELGIGTRVKDAADGILFARGGKLAQDDNHLFYDADSKRMGIGCNAPGTTLSLCGSSRNGQLHVMNNDVNDRGTSAVGFGRYGEEPEWILGSGIGGDPSDVFSLCNTKTGKKYILSEDATNKKKK